MSEMKRKVLLVDDSSQMRAVVRNYLKELPIEFLEAPNGREAETRLQEQAVMEEPVHLVVLDWMMPEMTGIEFLQKIRGTSVFGEYPKVVMLTAETNSEQMDAAMKYRVDQYITKPFAKEAIVAAVSKVLQLGGSHGV